MNIGIGLVVTGLGRSFLYNRSCQRFRQGLSLHQEEVVSGSTENVSGRVLLQNEQEVGSADPGRV